jgi:peptide/nickel transport system substrate-binding protein
MKSVWGHATLAAMSMAAMTPAFGAPSNEQLVIATTQEFETLNPNIMSMATSTYLSYMVDRPLMVIDNAWNWQCELCTIVPSLENGLAKVVEDKGVKKLKVDWQLKPGLTWGDGKPVTGHDFKLSWEIGVSPNVSVQSKETFEKIEAIVVDAKDPSKFTTIYKEPRYDFYQLSLNPMPSHLEADVWAKTKSQNGAYEKQTKYTTDPTNPGLYNGPYVITELKLGSHVVVKPNPNYAGTKPSIKKIVVKLIPNTQALEAALMSGDIDMANELGMTFDQAVEFDKRMMKDPASKDRFKTLFRDGLVYEHIDLNLRNPIFADKNVRKALVHAIDRNKLTQALFAGKQKPAISNFHPLDPYFTDDVVHYEPDTKKAAAMLDAAGWKVGPDGIRVKDGKKFEISIMTTADNKTRELVQQYIQAEFKKIGVALSIKNEPARVFFGETTRKAAYPALAMYAWISSPDNPPRSTLHSKEIPTEANGWSGQNSAGFSNKRVDELLEQVYLEFDATKRKAMMAEVQKIYTDEVPVIPLYLRAQIATIPAKMQGFELTGHLFYSTVNVEKWTFEPKVASH